jgi:hypothetical protein
MSGMHQKVYSLGPKRKCYECRNDENRYGSCRYFRAVEDMERWGDKPDERGTEGGCITTSIFKRIRDFFLAREKRVPEGGSIETVGTAEQTTGKVDSTFAKGAFRTPAHKRFYAKRLQTEVPPTIVVKESTDYFTPLMIYAVLEHGGHSETNSYRDYQGGGGEFGGAGSSGSYTGESSTDSSDTDSTDSSTDCSGGE